MHHNIPPLNYVSQSLLIVKHSNLELEQGVKLFHFKKSTENETRNWCYLVVIAFATQGRARSKAYPFTIILTNPLQRCCVGSETAWPARIANSLSSLENLLQYQLPEMLDVMHDPSSLLTRACITQPYNHACTF